MLILENSQLDSPGKPSPGAVFAYSQRAFHAIQEAVLDGYSKSPKGREESAGVLYGTREGNIVRVQAARRIACGHARGRTFLLSASETAALKEQLAREAAEPALQGLAVVGWFLSHAAPIRMAMTANARTVLSSADLQIFDEYFGAPSQVTLVLRPHASATMQASVFARRADGSVHAGESDLDFSFEKAAALPDVAMEVERKPPQRAVPAARAVAAAAGTMAAGVSAPAARPTLPAMIPAMTPATSLFSQAAALAPAAPPEPAAPVERATPALPAQPRVRKPDPAAHRRDSPKPAAPVTPEIPVAPLPGSNSYPTFGSYSEPAPRFTFEFVKFFDGVWGFVGVALLAGLASMPLGVKYFRSLPESAPISLTVSERHRQIQVRWNHSSRVIREAAQGTIEILDGSQSRSAVLSADDLAHGSVIFVRHSGDLQVRLEVENANGQKTLQVAHFSEPHP